MDKLLHDATRMQAVVDGSEDDQLFGLVDDSDTDERSSETSEYPPSPGGDDVEKGRRRKAGGQGTEADTMQPAPSGDSMQEIPVSAPSGSEAKSSPAKSTA